MNLETIMSDSVHVYIFDVKKSFTLSDKDLFTFLMSLNTSLKVHEIRMYPWITRLVPVAHAYNNP